MPTLESARRKAVYPEFFSTSNEMETRGRGKRKKVNGNTTPLSESSFAISDDTMTPPLSPDFVKTQENTHPRSAEQQQAVKKNSPSISFPMAKTKKKTDRELDKRREIKKLSMRRARERLREDPVKYAEEKKKDRERKKLSRRPVQDLSEREQRRIRKKWRERSKRYRDGKRNAERARVYENNFLESITPPDSPQTIQQPQQPLVEANGHRNTTPRERGKKIARKNRDRMRNEIENLNKLVKSLQKTVNKYKKRASRAKQENVACASSPRSKVDHMIKKQTVSSKVRRQLLFAEVISEQVRRNFSREKKMKNKRYFLSMLSGDIINKYKFMTRIGRLTSVKVNTFKQSKPLTEQRILIAQKKVTVFLERDENSRLTAGKKETITRQKNKKQRRLLNDTLINLHKKFVASHPEHKKMSYATFSKLRPFWILKPSHRDRDTCLCKQHANISLIVQSLKSHKIINESTINEVIKTLCCGDSPQEKCLERSCSLCIDRVPHFNDFDEHGVISYQTWAIKKEEVFIKGQKKVCSKTVKESITCSKIEVVNILKTSLKKFMQHVCNINHQYKALDYIRKNLSDTEVMLHMDFSENYVLKYASEVQASHFGASKKQISLHTSVFYHANDMMKPVSYGTFSNCLRHDPAAICAHLIPVLKDMKQVVPNLKTIHFVSDGPTTQYRNKTMFHLASSYLPRIVGAINIFWHFSEAGHGKGAPDGIGGCLKRSADGLVARGKDLPCLEILVQELKEACKGINVLVVTEQSISEMDKEVCFICQGSLIDGDVVTVRQKGVKTLISSSVQRKNNEHRRYLTNLSEVKVHSACQKHYNNPKLISSYLKRASEPSTSTRRSNVFDLRKHCFYCGKEADDNWEENLRRLPYAKRNLIHKVMKLELRDSVIEVARRRGDNWASEVWQRISDEDLCARDAWYHRFCQRDFYRPVRSGGEKGRPLSKDVDEAMEMIFSYIENNPEECQFSLEELMNQITTENVPQARTVKTRLLEKYDEDILIVETKKKKTVVCFKNTGYKILSDSFYQSRLLDPREERLRIVSAAADIIREDIRSQVYEISQYPPPDDFLKDVESVIPESLLHFFESLILKNKRGTLEKWKKRCVALSHAVISAVRPRSFLSSLLIGLSTFIYKRFGSRLLVDALSAIGFVATYAETTLLEMSSIVRPEQPRVTTDGFLQFIFDNADFNINTIDGLNTFHSMGGIMVVTPHSAIESERNIDRQVRMSSSDVLTSVGVPQLTTFHRTDNGGLNTIIMKDLNLNDPVALEVTLSGCEILWLYGKWTKRADVPGWGGYMEEATNHGQSPTSKILCLPFLNYPPTLYDTIYTSLLTASKKCVELGQQSCFVTFDQPLYVKAKDIVSSDDSDLKNVIVRLGGFHLLMSFMGCIGVIMAGSGLRDLLSIIFAENSLDKILSGHAYARAVRAHMLVHMVLSFYIFQEIEFTDGEKEVMEELLLFENRPSVLTCHENKIYKHVMIKFNKALHTIAGRGPTAKLWTQYFYMVTIMKQFIEAERMGNWLLHLDTIKKMLPYFHSAGHFQYAKSAHLYLQEMLTLEEQMDPTEFKKFTTEGFFTIRRSDKFWCGVWSDMTIEQTLMKTMKVKGGLTHGRGFSDSVLTKWTSGMATLHDVCQRIEEFCDISTGTSEQHVDLRPSRRDRNAADSEKLNNWLLQHPPFPPCNVLMSVSSGVIGGPEVNCHLSVEVGSMGIAKIMGQDFKNVSFKRKDKVVTLASCTALKIGGKTIATINPLTLFHRLCVVKQSDEDLKYCFSFELAPYPMSMFTEEGLRKGKLPTLLEQHPKLKEQAAAFLKPSVSQDEIAQAGEQLIMSLYGKMDSGTLDELRYELFVKSASKKSFNLARLPPTSDAARWHSMRVYQQVQTWLGCPISPCQWGWRKLPSGLVPIQTTKDAAPDMLLKMISCTCKIWPQLLFCMQALLRPLLRKCS
ncbi:unnamed protein product [Phaedon cochleariae]|uniref:Uncharacterized protein n=1 Tax=Phaedon cochleariae TaxID=80249 RepID=A0A9P0D9H9_PHACE|nr:unnamed protein product [Phaedon cochleariae]